MINTLAQQNLKWQENKIKTHIKAALKPKFGLKFLQSFKLIEDFTVN